MVELLNLKNLKKIAFDRATTSLKFLFVENTTFQNFISLNVRIRSSKCFGKVAESSFSSPFET